MAYKRAATYTETHLMLFNVVILSYLGRLGRPFD